MMVPWRDRHGRFLPLKAAVLLGGCIPGLVLAFWWVTGALGGRPVTEVIHGTGDWAIRFLLISLAITPAARVLDWPRILLVRRIVGLTALAYAVAHFSLYVVDENFHLLLVASEILRRFYLTIGFVTLLGLSVLGVTSTDGWMRQLGRWWKRLHRAIYVLGVVALLHYFIQSKSNVSEPVFMAGVFVWLMLWRVLPVGWQRSTGGATGAERGGGVRDGGHRVRLVCAGDRDQSVARAGGERDDRLRPAPGTLRGTAGIWGHAAQHVASDRRDVASAQVSGGRCGEQAGFLRPRDWAVLSHAAGGDARNVRCGRIRTTAAGETAITGGCRLISPGAGLRSVSDGDCRQRFSGKYGTTCRLPLD